MKQPIRAVRSERNNFEKEPKKKNRAGDDQCSIDIGYKQKKKSHVPVQSLNSS